MVRKERAEHGPNGSDHLGLGPEGSRSDCRRVLSSPPHPKYTRSLLSVLTHDWIHICNREMMKEG